MDTLNGELDQLLLANGEWVTSSEIVGRRGSWNRSREIVRLEEGATEIQKSTVLHFLATLKFPEGIPEGKEPFWKDKNWQNESLENVDLMTRAGAEIPGKVRESEIPFPSGSREYQAEYRKRHPEKFREANRKYQKKAREALRGLKGSVASPAVIAEEVLENEKLSEMEQKLKAIRETVAAATQQEKA